MLCSEHLKARFVAIYCRFVQMPQSLIMHFQECIHDLNIRTRYVYWDLNGNGDIGMCRCAYFDARDS